MNTRKISSFAAPTDADIAAFDAMSDAEKRDIIRTELDKGQDEQPVPWTNERRDRISARVSDRLKAYAPN